MPKAHLDPAAPASGSITSSGTPNDEPIASGDLPPPPVGVTRSGFVALIGRPNVGKSTLMNHILGEKLAIVSPKPQTTRTRLLGIKNLPEAQLALVDTPGMHRPDGRGRTLLNRYMVDEALSALADVDVVLLMTDLDTQRAQKAAPPDPAPGPSGNGAEPIDEATRAVRALLHPADRYVVQQLGSCGKPLVLAINKVDLLRDKKLLLPLIAEWTTLQNFRAIIPICAERGDGVDQLLEVLCAAVPAGDALFPPDMLTDRAERFLVAELVREQVFLAAREELPYSIAVTIDAWEERIAPTGHRAGERIGVIIDATVHVEKANQKKIIVGEGGHMVRDLGIAARQAISELLGCGVHLSLFVRVDEEWTASSAGLRKMGYETPTSLTPAPTTKRRPPQPQPQRAGVPAADRPAPPPHAAELTVKVPPPPHRAAEPAAKGPPKPQPSAQRTASPPHRAGAAAAKDPRKPHRSGEPAAASPKPYRAADAPGKGPRKPHRSDERAAGPPKPYRSADAPGKGPRKPHRSDERAAGPPKPYRSADATGKGPRKPHRADEPTAKDQRQPHRSGEATGGKRQPDRSAEPATKGSRPTPPAHGRSKIEHGGSRRPPLHSSHASHTGPGEHAK